MRRVLLAVVLMFAWSGIAQANLSRSCVQAIKKKCPKKKYRALVKRIKCSKLIQSDLSIHCQKINTKWINLLKKKQPVKARVKAFARKYKLWIVLFLIMASACLIGMFMVFIKAGYEGMIAFVPVYNLTILMRICALPPNWAFIMATPLCIFLWPRVAAALAESFSQDSIFARGLTFAPFIWLIILGFSEKIQYQGRGRVPDISFDLKL